MLTLLSLLSCTFGLPKDGSITADSPDQQQDDSPSSAEELVISELQTAVSMGVLSLELRWEGSGESLEEGAVELELGDEVEEIALSESDQVFWSEDGGLLVQWEDPEPCSVRELSGSLRLVDGDGVASNRLQFTQETGPDWAMFEEQEEEDLGDLMPPTLICGELPEDLFEQTMDFTAGSPGPWDVQLRAAEDVDLELRLLNSAGDLIDLSNYGGAGETESLQLAVAEGESYSMVIRSAEFSFGEWSMWLYPITVK